MQYFFLLLAFCLISSSSVAERADIFSKLIVYGLAERKRIKGWYDEDNRKEEGFKGC